ncbi:MAG: putative thiol-disulfide oxidoreductase [Friedmanniella sp.]|nr:putative thiol-disulfide oxidoreductase [Friedmanniella sp.]
MLPRPARPRTPSPRPGRGRRLLALALSLAGVVASGACTTTGADEQTRSAGQTGYVGVSGNLTRIAPDQRRAVPPVTGARLGSEAAISSGDYAGQVVVVNIWGSWCPPCRAEAPDLQAASVRTKGRAQFLGVTVKDYDPAPAEAFVRAFQITYPSIYDPTGQVLLTFAGDLPPSAIPSTLVIDGQGRLAARVLGPVTTSTLVGMVDDVANGK